MTREIAVTVGDDGHLTLQDVGYVVPDGVARQTLPVAGGVIETNLHSPELGLRAVIDDVDAAQWWIPFAFGMDAADAVAAHDTATEATHVVVPSEIAADVDLANVAHRLLVGFWFRRWWPAGVVDAPLQEWLLDAELGALAAEAEAVFGGVAIASALLTPLLDVIADDVEQAGRRDAVPMASTRRDAVRRAALAAADTADAHADGFDRLLAAVSQVTRDDVATAVSVPDAVVARTPASGGHGDPVDWRSVHPRQVSSDEDAIRFTVRQDADGAAVDVVVAAPASVVSMPAVPGELYARVVVGGEVDAVALDPAPDRYHGLLSIADAQPVEVSVYADTFGAGGRDTPDPAGARAVRDVVWDIVVRRLTTAADGIAAFAFEDQLRIDAAKRLETIITDAVADIDVEWLVLAERSLAFRDGAERVAYAADDVAAGIGVLVSRSGNGWLVRVESDGVEGAVTVTVRFASGAITEVTVHVVDGGLADAVIDGAADDLPVAVRARVESQ